MRAAFIILIGIHTSIHLLGFFSAFNIVNTPDQQVISKLSGVLFLVAFLLFGVTLVHFSKRLKYWWVWSLVTITISQILIFNHWSTTKYNTLINLLLLLVSCIAFANYRFKQKVQQERKALFSKISVEKPSIVSTSSITELPIAVQKWLQYSGIIGKKDCATVFLTQELRLKLQPTQTSWYVGTAEQYFTTQSPAFHWTTNIQLNSLLNVVGRDQFKNGKGRLLIRLLSLFALAKVSDTAKINQATLQRYLAEIVWFPSAAISSYISWQHIDDFTAKATMEYNNTKGTGTFYFNEDGSFQKFVALRYKDNKDLQTTQWTVSAIKNEKRNGVYIPTECNASWKLNNKEWTWLQLKITNIEYDF